MVSSTSIGDSSPPSPSSRVYASLESGDDVVEAFTDADWAGDMSTQVRKRHSVSSALVYVNNRLICSWSRTQKSIALSSCESEYLSAVSGGAEALYVSRLWSFLTRRNAQARIVTDSSSCRAFSQRQGVGRLTCGDKVPIASTADQRWCHRNGWNRNGSENFRP